MVEGHKTILMTKLTESKMIHREKLTDSQVAGSPRGVFLGHRSPDCSVQWTEVQGNVPSTLLKDKLSKVMLTCSRHSEGSEA